MKRKKTIRFQDAKSYAKSFGKKMFKNNHYFRNENRWCVLAKSGTFEQTWGRVKGSLKRSENYKCFAFYLSTHGCRVWGGG